MTTGAISYSEGSQMSEGCSALIGRVPTGENVKTLHGWDRSELCVRTEVPLMMLVEYTYQS